MSDGEVLLYGSGAGNKPKKKTRKITHGRFFYTDLYILSADLYDMMHRNRDMIFPQLPKPSSRTTCIHAIGHWIAEKRIRYDRGDIHNIGDDVGFLDVIRSPEYADKSQYYILTQSSTMEFLFGRYGVKGEQKAITVDDKVHVAGIIFCEEMRQYIPDLIGTSRGSKVRAVLDAAPGRKLYAMTRLMEKFIDPEVVVEIPPKWNTIKNKKSVDKVNGEGAFDRFGTFVPNNLARIALPWTQTEVSAIFVKMLAEYNATMEKYTKGTGGGSGSHAMFGVWDEARSEAHKKWKERPMGWIAQYAGQMSMLYLGLVLMWDATFGYILCAQKDPMPDDCMIDDSYLAEGHGSIDDDDDNRNSVVQLRTPQNSIGGVLDSGRKSSSKKGLESMLSEMIKVRESSKETQQQMLELLKKGTSGADTGVDSNQVGDGGTATLVKNISDTIGVIDGCKKTLKSMIKRKKQHIRKGGNSLEAEVTIKSIRKDIKKQRRLIETLEDALDSQQRHLRSVTKGKAKNDLDNDDDIDDDNDNDDNDDDDEDDDDKDDRDDDGDDNDSDK